MVVDLQHLRVYIVFRFMTIFDDVDMNRLVIIRVKLEDISEYDKYRWHNVLRCINTKIQINGKLSTPLIRQPSCDLLIILKIQRKDSDSFWYDK